MYAVGSLEDDCHSWQQAWVELKGSSMNMLRRVASIICIASAIAWGGCGIKLMWGDNTDEEMVKWFGTFGIITIVTMVALGAAHYARGRGGD